ncbi:tyrosine-type recombinase/integrase [Patescibacteria group bacterium]|nr:tyrosine-type recombinase/integrase [Patescibacteria group bacterium]MBU0777418.1 tyrosine-type recombinase/integrase [Patescibacteria group bacterium]MBU0846054.1 tyrosine-type recombinase/integrase [Patescibacteria group bacterium]MBU0922446.1 tyrosine-type recombinase/integrase [Patescibacteria group bacterium]MBU1066821.1 tyrosine-type recombinase/integrase [Patescibacteria group bacterium]
MTQDTFKNLLPKFTKALEEKGRSPSTILAYRADLEQLIDFLQGKNKVLTGDARPADIEAFRDSLLAQKYTPKSVSRKLNAVKTFFRWLVSEKLVVTDSSVDVAHPKIEPSVPKFLSPIEYRALRDVVRGDDRIAAIVEIILQVGLRISEVADLKIANISKDKVKIEAYATQPERTIPFNKPAKDVLARYLKLRPKTDSPYVFVSKNGNPLAVRNIRAAIDRYMQRAEVPGYSVNDLRTTFLVENLKAGVDLILLSQVMGHKRLSTTERYLELAEVKEPGKKQVLEEL